MSVNIYGFIIAIASFVSFVYLLFSSYKREMPLLFQLMFGILLSAPFIIFGSRIWTIWFSNNEQINIGNSYENIFLLSGLSIHGALFFGFIYIYFLFFWYSKKTKISKLYLFDWFIPSVLIMQIIGRLGNYFNNEITGINEEPLFLYEMIGNFFILLFLLFFLPNLYKFFFIELFTKKNLYKFKLDQIKNEIKNTNSIFKKIKLYFLFLKQKNFFLNNFLFLYSSEKNTTIKISKTNNFYYRSIEVNSKEEKLINKIYKRIKLFCLRNSSDLTKAHNPLNLKITRVGVVFCFYIILSFSLRLILQFSRKTKDSMFITIPFLIIFIIIFIVLFIIFQFILPKKYRTKDWYYEVRY